MTSFSLNTGLSLKPRIRLYMAPLKGFSDHIFRSAFADHFGGFDLAVAPFIASNQDTRIKRKYVKVDPFLPGRITTGADDIPDKIYRMQRFHTALFEAYSRLLDGPCQVLNKMKGFWQYFSLSFEDCKQTMIDVRKAHQPDQYLAQVNLFFETKAQWRRSQANLSA